MNTFQKLFSNNFNVNCCDCHKEKNGKKFENSLKEVRRLRVKRAIGLPSPKNTPHSLQHKLQGMGDFPPLKMRK